MPTVFISRTLDPDHSPLLQWAMATGNEVVGQSLITFGAMPFLPPVLADWWFFYSPRAVAFSVGQLPHAGQSPRPQLAAMGPGTARALEAAGWAADFVGQGDPTTVARAFGRVAAGQRVFFPRARQSRKTVQTLLADELTVLDAICYDNVPVPAVTPVTADVFVFTSPLSVAAYLDHQPLPPAARVIALGPRTAQALTDREVACAVAEQPGEAGVVALL